MRRLGALVLLLITATAYAIHPATKAESDRIRVLIDEARVIENERLPLLEIQMSRALDDSKNGHPDPAAIANLENAIKSARQRVDLARDEAIHGALTAYGIVETGAGGQRRMPHGIAVTEDLSNGRPIEWVVVSGLNGPRKTQDAKGRSITVGGTPALKGRAATGLTATDGVSVLYPGAFGSPEELALYLYHERWHFEQYTTKGMGDVMTNAESEVDAWRLTRQAIAKVGLSPEAQAKLDRKTGEIISDWQAKAVWERRIKNASLGVLNVAINRLPAPFEPGERDKLRQQQANAINALADSSDQSIFADRDTRTLDTLRAIREGQDRLKRRIDQENAVLQQFYFERYKAVAPPMPAVSAGPAAFDFPNAPSEAWELAQKACRGQDVSQDELDVVLGHLAVCRKQHGFAVPSAGGCVEKLFATMAESAGSGRSIRASWFNDAAHPPKVAPPPETGTSRPYVPDDSGDRGRDRSERSRGHDIPDRHWNPTFHLN